MFIKRLLEFDFHNSFRMQNLFVSLEIYHITFRRRHFHLLEYAPTLLICISCCKEVVDRLAAKVGDDAYGR